MDWPVDRHGLDLWRTVRSEGYDVDSQGFEIKLRGHVGEHEVESQLSAWADGRIEMPDASNNPAFDLTLDGHPLNVKVGQDASAIRNHLAEHPDIPVVVNADMDGLPDDAMHLDLNQPFDPDLLADHSVIVADGLLLSDLQDSMADSFGPALDSFGLDDLFDGAGEVAVPVLGSALRVVRSGWRENKLRAVHGDNVRAMRNIGTDLTLVGGGVAGGGALGLGLGALLDVATFGATGGLGATVIGPAIGAFLGGRAGGKEAAEVRLRPLSVARAATTAAVERYDRVVTEASAKASTRWATVIVPRAEQDAAERAKELRRTAVAVHARARQDLEATTRMSEGDRRRLLAAAGRGVEASERRARTTWLARRRIASWRAAAERVRGDNAVLDVVVAAPGGSGMVRNYLAQTSQRRGAVLASSAVAGTRLQRRADTERQRIRRDLVRERDKLHRHLRKQADPHAEALAQCVDRVRHELVATGAQTEEWVDEHFPPQQK